MTRTILVLAANPKDTSRLRLDQEVREIDNGLQRACRRDEFVLKQIWAARPLDVRRAMLDLKPNIVHFCGHGAGEDGIAFEDETGNTKLVSAQALAGFFELFSDKVKCVVLNTCYSEVQAEAIARHIEHVIGMKKGVGDTAAIEFAVAFYDALGAGKSVEFAYKLACNAIQWAGLPQHLIPVLKTKHDVMERIDCVVLCGGYSVRLWPLTIDISKVLLPVAGRPVLEYVLDFVQASSAIKTTIVSVNQRYAPQIQEFIDSYQPKHPIELIVEPTKAQKEKLGPIGALDYIVSRSAPRDLLVLGGDNLFGFRLDEFLQFSANAQQLCSYNALYQYQAQGDPTEYGIVNIGPNGEFLEFQEKPMRSIYRNISTACYLFRERDVEAIHKYIENGQDPDSLGSFIHWLLTEHGSRIGSYLFSSFWFDVGTRDALLQANGHYLQHIVRGDVSNTTLLEPVYVAEGAKISDSKLGPNVYIGPGVQAIDSSISNSIIMDQCIIQNSDLINSVTGSGSIVESQKIELICGPNSKVAK